MKIQLNWVITAILLMMTSVACHAGYTDSHTFVGCTPAHLSVRRFLGISTSDSIDFIRWKLDLDDDGYSLFCRYGLSRPNTQEFSNEQQVRFSGSYKKVGNYIELPHTNYHINLMQVNDNLLHFLDQDHNMLSGNAGYSFALNLTTPVETNVFNESQNDQPFYEPQMFEGRTPCLEIASLLQLQKSSDCFKLKWNFLFYTDENGKPTYYQTRKVVDGKLHIEKGNWKILQPENGRTIYQLQPEDQSFTLYLLKAGNNVLFFADANGNPLVGNENFSYTLNRRIAGYDPTR